MHCVFLGYKHVGIQGRARLYVRSHATTETDCTAIARARLYSNEMSLSSVMMRSAAAAERVRIITKRRLDALVAATPGSASHASDDLYYPTAVHWLPMPIDEEGSVIRAALPIVCHTVPFCAQALSLVLSTYMLAMNTAAVQPAIDALASAKREDDLAYDSEIIFCAHMRALGLCRLDVLGWLYDA